MSSGVGRVAGSGVRVQFNGNGQDMPKRLANWFKKPVYTAKSAGRGIDSGLLKA
jgi:hypothetical protein